MVPPVDELNELFHIVRNRLMDVEHRLIADAKNKVDAGETAAWVVRRLEQTVEAIKERFRVDTSS